MLEAQGSEGAFTDKDGQAKFACPSGDHETLLEVYEGWEASGRSSKWCGSHGVRCEVLKAAAASLQRVHVFMNKSQIPLCSLELDDPQRWG